jgi:gluconolactonase
MASTPRSPTATLIATATMLASAIALGAAEQDFQASAIVEKGAKLQKLGSGFKFTEGPAGDPAGNVYFTDQPNDRIWKWTTDGKLAIFLEPCGRSNGMCFDAKGQLISCADEHNQLWAIDPGGKATVLIKDYQGKLLNGPNDVWIHPHGEMYITDPYYKRDYWKRGPKEQAVEGVYRLSADRTALTLVANDLVKPNGIIGTPDGALLYVSDIEAGITYSYTVEADASLTHKKKFCDMGSDGMTIDDQGNVYLTNHGVTVFAPSGAKILHIDIDEGWTGNICFAGADHKLLFITASTSIYGLRMATHGVGSQ